MTHLKNKLKITLVVVWAALSLGAHPLASAQTGADQSSAIPAGGLGTAVQKFARDSGVIISYEASVVKGLTTPGLQGKPPFEAGLSQLLVGQPVTWAQSNGVYTLKPAGLKAQAKAGQPHGATAAYPDEVPLASIYVVGKRLDQKDKTYRQAGTEYFINKQDIERFRGMSTGDFVKSIPGVLTGDNRNSGAIDLNIRGMQGMNRVPVVIDGSLQSTTVYRGYSGVASRNYLDPDLIASVAIEKGPTSGADGVGATGGVARMRTISAKDIIPAGEDWGIQLKGSFLTNTSSVPATGTIGGFQTSFISACSSDFDIPVGDGGGRPTGQVVQCEGSDGNLSDEIKRPNVLKPSGGSGSIAIAKKWENIDFMLAYAQRQQGNYHAGKKGATPKLEGTSSKRYHYQGGRWLEITDATFDSDSLNRFRAGEAVLNTSNKNKSLLFKSNISLPGDQTLELGYMKYKSDFGELMPSLVLRGEGAYQAQLSHVEVDTYTLRHRWVPNDIAWIDLKTDVWQTKTNTSMQNYYRFAMYYLPFDPLLIIHPEGFWETSVRKGINVSNSSEFSPEGWGDVRLDYGVSLGRERIKPYGDTDKKGTEAGGWALVNRDGWRKEWSGFFSAEYDPNSWLSLATSLRYVNVQNHDNGQYFIDDQCLRTNPRTGTCSSWSKKWANRPTQKHHAATPIASISFKPTEAVQFYARYAEAARAPMVCLILAANQRLILGFLMTVS